MVCKKCESENVSIQMVQTSAKSKTKGKGCLFTLGRWGTVGSNTMYMWVVVSICKKRKQKPKPNLKMRRLQFVKPVVLNGMPNYYK